MNCLEQYFSTNSQFHFQNSEVDMYKTCAYLVELKSAKILFSMQVCSVIFVVTFFEEVGSFFAMATTKVGFFYEFD